MRHVYVLEETWTERDVYKKSIIDPLQKVIFVPFGRQPNYSDIFHIITEYIEPRRDHDDIWMIINADIILGEGFNLLRGNVANKTLLALSRHNSKQCHSHNQCLDFRHSTDSFLGIGPVDNRIMKQVNFRQNILGAENVLLYEFKKAGYRLLNPCLNIKIYHNHCSGVRTWKKRRINTYRSVSVQPSKWTMGLP